MPQKPTTPDKAAEISAIVSRLLLHYWTATEHAAIRQAQVEDWIEDLIEFDLDIIRDACAIWRRRPKASRPLPGQVRALCVDMQQERKEEQHRAIAQQQDGGTWPQWLYDIWGPASTGRIARQQALDDMKRRYARGRAYREGRLAEFDLGLGEQEDFKPGKNFRFTDQEVRERLEYARMKGYETWNDFLAAVEDRRESMMPFYDWSVARRPGPKLVAVKGFKTIGEALNLAQDEDKAWRKLGFYITHKPEERSPFASYPDDPT